jgi:hypothetical protein
MNTTDHHAPRYPDITVQLSGEDGNAFAILSRVKRELRRGLLADGDYTAGEIANEVRLFCEQATEGDYNHLLQTCMRWVDVA